MAHRVTARNLYTASLDNVVFAPLAKYAHENLTTVDGYFSRNTFIKSESMEYVQGRVRVYVGAFVTYIPYGVYFELDRIASNLGYLTLGHYLSNKYTAI